MKALYISEDKNQIILRNGDDLSLFNLVGESEELPSKKQGQGKGTPKMRGERRPNLTDDQKDEIMRDYVEGIEPKEIAKKFDISMNTVYNIKKKMEGLTPGIGNPTPSKPNPDVNLFECGDCHEKFVSKKTLDKVKCNMKANCTNKKIKQLERND